METEKKRFSAFAKQAPGLDGEKTSIEAIVNVEIMIVGCKIKPSKYPGKNKSGQCLHLQFEIDQSGARFVAFTGSDVLISQLKEYGDEIPFWATIKKVDKYYTLT